MRSLCVARRQSLPGCPRASLPPHAAHVSSLDPGHVALPHLNTRTFPLEAEERSRTEERGSCNNILIFREYLKTLMDAQNMLFAL